MSKHWPITHFGTDYNMQAFERTSDLEKDPDANRNKIIIIHISRRVGGGKACKTKVQNRTVWSISATNLKSEGAEKLTEKVEWK